MALHSTVPIELFEAVIDEASIHPASLHCLSFTCQAFLPRARYHLFNNIVIQSVERLDAFCKFLETHSWAPALVKKITLAMALRFEPCTPTIRLLDVAATHLLSRLPNLRAWRMEVAENECGPMDPAVLLSPHRSALSCYEQHGGHIQDLELSNISFDNMLDFQALVLAFTGISSLSCSHIRFRTTTTEGAGPNTLAQPPRLKHLRVGASVDICAVKYLLDAGLDALENLVLTISSRSRNRDVFDRLEKSIGRLSRIASLTLVIACERLLSDDHDADAAVVQDIRCAIKILQCAPCARLETVRVEFTLDRLASFGRCFSWGGAPLDACKTLEDTLFTFPRCGIVFDHSAASHGRRRAKFWFPSVKRAFPKLDERGLLTFISLQSDDPEPLGHEGRVTCLVASPNSKSIVSASLDGTIIVWDAARGTITQELLAHQGSVNSLALSPDGTRLASSGGVGSETFAVWEIADAGARKVAAPEGHTQPVTTCAWSPDGALIASASADGTVRVWDAQTFQQRDLVDDPRSVAQPRLLQFSPDSRYLAWISSSPTDGHTCALWRPLADAQPRTLPSQLSRLAKGHVTIYAFSFDPMSRRVATAHGYSHGPSLELDVVRIWDLATGDALAVLAGRAGAGAVVDVSFCPDGVSLLAVSSDSSVTVWNVERGEEISSFREGPGRRTISKACFSPDGKYVATASWEKTVRVWRTGDATCAAVFSEHGDSVRHVAFSPDGEFLTSGDDGGVVHIRRVSSFVER